MLMVNLQCFQHCVSPAFSGLNNLSQAEEYLAQAQWTVLKTPDVSDAIKSKLFRNIGLLHAATGRFTNQLSSLR